MILPDTDKVYIAGHAGLVGSAIVRQLQAQGFNNLLLRRKAQLDLRSQPAVSDFFRAERPDIVILAAAKVGGIGANNRYPAEFIGDNLIIQHNIIDAAYRNGVKKLLFMGSSCIYPKLAPQPMKEKYLLSGPLEATNEWYAIAKIAGIKQCQAYRRQYGLNAISLMPTNLYGPGDNFHLDNAHVLPALMRRFHTAKMQQLDRVTVWGSGMPRREFLHVDDLAEAAVFLLKEYDSGDIINVGVGKDISIAELAALIKEITGFSGRIDFDTSNPDGTPRKLLDVSRLNALGWQAKIGLREGIERTYRWFLDNQDRYRTF